MSRRPARYEAPAVFVCCTPRLNLSPVGGAFTPELYRCVVSIAGDADLIQMLDEERQLQGRGAAGYAYWVQITGDPNRDRHALNAVSPMRHAANFRAPVLLLHGRDDYTVQVTHSEEMRDALQRAGKQVRYVDFEHEGHYWANCEPGNRQRMLEEIDTFLSQNLVVAKPGSSALD